MFHCWNDQPIWGWLFHMVPKKSWEIEIADSSSCKRLEIDGTWNWLICDHHSLVVFNPVWSQVWSLTTDLIRHNCNTAWPGMQSLFRYIILYLLLPDLKSFPSQFGHYHHWWFNWIIIESFVPLRRKVSNGGWFKSDVCSNSGGSKPAGSIKGLFI